MKRTAFPRPKNNRSSKFIYGLNVMLAMAVTEHISIKHLKIIAGIRHLQRRNEEILVGEVHAIHYEITKDPSWSYEACREMCNRLSKAGWLDKHKLGRSVGYTPSAKAVELLDSVSQY